MEWQDLIKARENTFAWDYDKEVNVDDIKQAMVDAYNYAPTKNLKYPYQAILLKNDNSEVRKEIMTICHRNKDLDIEDDPGNPQVLAPYLIGFTQRDVRDLEVLYQKTYTRPSRDVERYDHLEIGILATYLMLGLKSRGIDTGLCQNCSNNEKRTAELFGVYEPVVFLLGVGHSKGPGRHIYFDPRANKERPIPYAPSDKTVVYPKPSFEKIFKLNI